MFEKTDVRKSNTWKSYKPGTSLAGNEAALPGGRSKPRKGVSLYG